MPKSRLSDPIAEHRKKSNIRGRVAVITVSTTRSSKDDQSGDIIQQLLEKDGHTVAIRKWIVDNRITLRATLLELVRQKNLDAIITTGGTGIAASDITVETVRGMLEKELPGFNALFVLLSYRQARSAAVLSRALAGVIKGKPVFCLPGSPRACRLATASIILPELGHMLMLLGN